MDTCSACHRDLNGAAICPHCDESRASAVAEERPGGTPVPGSGAPAAPATEVLEGTTVSRGGESPDLPPGATPVPAKGIAPPPPEETGYPVAYDGEAVVSFSPDGTIGPLAPMSDSPADAPHGAFPEETTAPLPGAVPPFVPHETAAFGTDGTAVYAADGMPVFPPDTTTAYPADGTTAAYPPHEAADPAAPAFPGFPPVAAHDPALTGILPDDEPDPWGLDAAIEADRAAEAAAAGAEDDEDEERPSRSRLLYIGLLCGVLLGIVFARADEMPISINDEANGADVTPSDSPFPSPSWTDPPTSSPSESDEPSTTPEESEAAQTEAEDGAEQNGPTPDPVAPAPEQPAGSGDSGGGSGGSDSSDPDPVRTTPPAPREDPTSESPQPPPWEWPDQNGDCSVEWDATCYWDPPAEN
ncbi:hypothetical protein [Streptomyces sp. URMC 129]|uniref:hypothetical protein n=1 Tax=Streptomyces sp. URMC 129 TaxID=3423407 RepID=UPI003F1D4772